MLPTLTGGPRLPQTTGQSDAQLSFLPVTLAGTLGVLNLKIFCVQSPVSSDSMGGKGYELGETALASVGNIDSVAGPWPLASLERHR